MSRIKDLQKQVHRVLEKMEDEDKRLKAISHLHGVALAAAVLAVYLLVWFLAGGRSVWLKVGLGLLIADTALLLALVLWMDGSVLAFFWEFALHGAVIYELAMGISAQKKLDAMAQEEISVE